MRTRRVSFRFRCRASTIWSRTSNRSVWPVPITIKSVKRARKLIAKKLTAEFEGVGLKTVEEIKAAIEAGVPGAGVEIVSNPSVSGQHSLRLDAAAAPWSGERFCATTPNWRWIFFRTPRAWTGRTRKSAEKVKVTRTVTKTVDGVEQPVEETVEETRKRVEPGCLEAVYHLFSVEKNMGRW